jgi:hypothetical protein
MGVRRGVYWFSSLTTATNAATNLVIEATKSSMKSMVEGDIPRFFSTAPSSLKNNLKLFPRKGLKLFLD